MEKLNIQQMDNLGLKRTKEFINPLLKHYTDNPEYTVEYHIPEGKGKRVDLIIKIFKGDDLIKAIIIETKIRNYDLSTFKPTGSFSNGLMIEKSKYDLLKYYGKRIREIYNGEVMEHIIYLNFLKDATVLFDINNIVLSFMDKECNKTTHNEINHRINKAVAFIPISMGNVFYN